MMMTPYTARFPLINDNHIPHFDPYNNNNNNSNNGINNESPRPCVVAPETLKRKRGRPRKHSPPNGDTSLSVASTLPSSSSSVKKRGRGRPPGSRNKQPCALGSPVATNFTPHVIFVEPGEDIVAKIMAFIEQARRTIIIFSANGKVGNVTLRHTTGAEAVVTYEGLYELISMSGSFPLLENNNVRTGMSELIVALGGLGGIVIGGGVVGKLTATSTIQVVAGSFPADATKCSSKNLNSGPSFESSSQTSAFGAFVTPANPAFQGPSTGSSNDNDNENDIFSDGSGLYNNTSHPIHTFPMYHHQIWDAQTQQW